MGKPAPDRRALPEKHGQSAAPEKTEVPVQPGFSAQPLLQADLERAQPLSGQMQMAELVLPGRGSQYRSQGEEDFLLLPF